MSKNRTVPGRGGRGLLTPMRPGDPAKPGAGRPRNLFREAIRKMAEGINGSVELDAYLVIDGNVTEQRVRVVVEIPAVEAVVAKMFRNAAKKGDVAAARWLSETGWGKNINLGDDDENPLGGGFVVVLPDNNR